MTTEFWRPDPKLDLVLERVVDVPPELVWECWTQPEHLKVWFCPRPWSVSECDIDLRPGGQFRTVMCSPEGEKFPSNGCYLDVVPQKRLVWTDALQPGFRPALKEKTSCGLKGFMTGVILIEPAGKGTRYVAMALHSDAEAAQQHAEMGFAEGWGTCLTQLVEHAKGMR
jgi:uncharacterized protein YndB with AHSA1/START domain